MTVGKVRKEIAAAVKTDNKVSVAEARKIVQAAQDGKVTASECKVIADLFEGANKPAMTTAAKKLLDQFLVDNNGGGKPAEQIVKKVLGEFGLKQTAVYFPQAEVDRQIKLGGKVGFEAAVRASIKSFLEQGDEPGSPLNIIQEIGEAPDPKAAVRDYLNRSSTTLALVPAKPTDADKAMGLFPPENGETVAANWVISVRIPDLSESLHWAITDRSGKKPTYNYGFD